MKYIKKFNEAYNQNELEIKYFFESNLSSLIDLGYSVKVLGVSPLLKLNIENIHTVQILSNYKDKWSDIKDDIIPFLIILNKEYPIIRHREMQYKDGEWGLTKDYHDIWVSFSSGRKYFMIEDLVNDNIDLDQFGTFTSMHMTIKRK